MWLPEEVGTSEENSKEGQTIPVFSPFFFSFVFINARLISAALSPR